MKKHLKILALAIMAVFLVAGSAMAIPTGNLGSLQGVLDNITTAPVLHDSSVDVTTDYLSDPMDSYWDITATGGSVSTMIIELASYASGNIFGIYDPANSATTVDLFDGPSVAGDQVTLSIQADGSVYVNHVDTNTDFSGTTFGYFLDSSVYSGGGFWYSNTSLNIDGFDHMAAYQGTNTDTVEIPPWAPGLWTDSEFVLAFEDLDGGPIGSSSDWDFTDMVVMVESVQPIPEPATALLMGAGLSLLGLGALRRKKLGKDA